MKVEVAKSAGFCFGVKRAVDIVREQIDLNYDVPIYTYGPIIHNEEVVKDFRRHGVGIIEEDGDCSKYEKGIVIIRSHGVARNVQHKLEDCGFKVVDATCPFVKKIHRTVEEKSNEGYHIVIVGNPVPTFVVLLQVFLYSLCLSALPNRFYLIIHVVFQQVFLFSG